LFQENKSYGVKTICIDPLSTRCCTSRHHMPNISYVGQLVCVRICSLEKNRRVNPNLPDVAAYFNTKRIKNALERNATGHLYKQTSNEYYSKNSCWTVGEASSSLANGQTILRTRFLVYSYEDDMPHFLLRSPDILVYYIKANRRTWSITINFI
jgi:hypothetical protein